MAARQALVWPPVYDARSRRAKGFYPEVVKCSRLTGLVDTLRSLPSSHPEATRLSVRAIVHRDALDLLVPGSSGFGIEAHFPIDSVFPGCSLAYLSLNHTDRISNSSPSNPSLLAGQLRQLRMLQTQHRPMGAHELEPLTRRYQIALLPSMDMPTAQKISALFRVRFEAYPTDLAPDSIRRMPEDHLVVVAYAGSEIVSIFMADRASIDMDGKTLTFFDFVNVVSNRDGLLLIPRMAHRVIAEAAAYPNPVVYAEARADVLGLQVCCIRAGMVHAGTLIGSSLFQDRTDPRPSYRSTQVWYMPSSPVIDNL